MVRLNVLSFGRVEKDFLERILEVVRECYSRFKDSQPTLVDFYVFEKTAIMEGFMVEEKEKLEVLTSSFEESFFATHDAWYGIPRIMVCVEKMERLPWLLVVGGLRHEVVHTILHGSPEYYLMVLPKPLREIREVYNLPAKTVNDIFYLLSIAVKDYEVVRLLYGGGYVEDQVAYCKHYLKPSLEEKIAWEIAKTNPLAKSLFLTSILKSLCCAKPLLNDKNHGLEVKKAVDENLSYLPEKLVSRVFEVLRETEKFGFDTQKNIEFFSQTVTEKILKPILNSQI